MILRYLYGRVGILYKMNSFFQQLTLDTDNYPFKGVKKQIEFIISGKPKVYEMSIAQPDKSSFSVIML